MENIDRVMDSVDNLSVALKKIERYNFLFYLTGRMVISVLAFAAVMLFAYILLLMNDFQNANPELGTIGSGYGGMGGTALHNVFTILLVIGAVAVYLGTVFLNRRALKGREWKITPFDRTKGKDEVVGAITNIDWGKTRTVLKRAKFAFITYNISIVGIYSFLLFFILSSLYLFFSTLILYVLQIALHVPVTLYYQLVFAAMSVLSVVISLAILRKRLKSSLSELRDLDGTLDQLRWFLDEFEKSGFQA